MAASRFDVAALVAAAAASLLLALAPMGTSTSRSVSVSVGGTRSETTESTTRRYSLLESEGPSVLIPLAIPVLLAALPVVAPRRMRPRLAVVVAVLLGGFVVLAAMSIGVFYLPAAVLLAVAARRGRLPG